MNSAETKIDRRASSVSQSDGRRERVEDTQTRIKKEIAYGEIRLRPLATHRDILMRISIKLDNANNNQSQAPAVPR